MVSNGERSDPLLAPQEYSRSLGRHPHPHHTFAIPNNSKHQTANSKQQTANDTMIIAIRTALARILAFSTGASTRGLVPAQTKTSARV